MVVFSCKIGSLAANIEAKKLNIVYVLVSEWHIKEYQTAAILRS